MGTWILLQDGRAVMEEMIKEYIENQDNGRDDETFKIVKD